MRFDGHAFSKSETTELDLVLRIAEPEVVEFRNRILLGKN